MTFRTLELSTKNEAFFSLSTVKTDKTYLPVPNKAFPVTVAQDVACVYFALTGKELDPEENTILAHYQEGELKRIYGPKVYLNEESNGLLLRWGQEVVNLTLSEDNTFNTELGDKLVLEIADGEVNGFTCLCLQSAVETSDDAILTFNFPVGLADYQNAPKAKALNTLLNKKGFASIAEHFTQKPKGNGDSSPVYSTSNNLVSGNYAITAWKMYEKPDSTSCVVILADVKIQMFDEDENPTDLIEAETAKFWAPKKLVASIKAGLQPEGARFMKTDSDNGKFKYTVIGEYQLAEDILTLDWL